MSSTVTRKPDTAPTKLRAFHLPENWQLLTSFCLYAVALIWLYPLFQYRINPDGISYISLAEKYARSDWQHAISGQWSPLFTWCLALAFKGGFSPALAITLTQALASAILLWSSDRLTLIADLAPLSRLFLLLIVGLFALSFTFSAVTPDLLVAGLLTCYLALTADGQHLEHTPRAAVAGMVAALAYLAKAYAFDFIILHLAANTVSVFWMKVPGTRRATKISLRNAAVVLLTMLLVSSPWIACLSSKHGRLTLTTAGESRFREMAPIFREAGIENVELRPPPNATAYNFWEDPEQLNLPPWSPLQSTETRHYYLGWVGDQFLILLVWTFRISLAALPIFCVALFRWTRGLRDVFSTTLLSACLVYTAGYCLIEVLDRYVLPTAIWLLILSVWVLSNWMRTQAGRTAFVCGVVCLSFIPYPLFSLLGERHQGELEHHIGLTLKQRLPPNARVASLSEFHRSMYVSYTAHLKYYGVDHPNPKRDIKRELERFGIQYLFIWKDDNLPAHLLDGMQQVEDARLPDGLKIYASAAP